MNQEVQTFKQKMVATLKSRKFWVFTAAIVAVVGAYATGQINVWQALQGGIAAGAVYTTGIAIGESK